MADVFNFDFNTGTVQVRPESSVSLLNLENRPILGQKQETTETSGIGDYTVFGTYALSQILSGIAGYQAAKNNYSSLKKNYAYAYDAQEANISVLRQQNRMREGQNRAQIGASGIKSDSFLDVMQSNKIIEENDISVMRANLRNQMFADLRQGVEDKYSARKKAIYGAIGTIAGAYGGILTGNPDAALALTKAGGEIGQSLGG